MTRDAFVAAQDALSALRDENEALRQRLHAEALGAIQAAALLEVPRLRKTRAARDALQRKIEGDAAAGFAVVPAIAEVEIAKATAAYEAAYASIKARREVLEGELRAAAEGAVVEPSESWTQYDCVFTVSYNSQGFGASQYAQCAAEMRADHARHYGIESRVTREDDGTAGDCFPAQERWNVLVRASELDVAILKAKPSPPLKDVLRSILKRGRNVRVFFPWLPWGTEAQLGLDAFGNDIKMEAKNDR